MVFYFRSIALVLTGSFCLQAFAQSILTNEEIQILRDNGYTITVNEENNKITYEHHGVPDHTSEGGWGNPNDAEKVNHSYTLPLRPTAATVKGCASGLGVIGLAVSGGAFYNPYTGFGWNAVEGECAEELDNCQGHPSPDGTYHYHGVPDCLYTGDLRDKFLGVALDGYPIFGPMDSTGKNWTSADLDICHGHTYNGRYIYRATYDFPYIIGCFNGGDAQVQGQNRPGPDGDDQRPRPGSDGDDQRPPPPDNGERPQPAGGLQIPDGLENDKCWNVKYQDWETTMCHVVCRNPGQDQENCQTTDIKDSAMTVVSTPSIAFILVLSYISCIVSF